MSEGSESPTTPSLATEFESRWKEYQTDQQEVEQNAKTFAAKIHEDYKYRDKVLSKVKSQKKVLKELKEYADGARLGAKAAADIKQASTSLQRISDQLTPGSGR
jgi:hypothetical protein